MRIVQTPARFYPYIGGVETVVYHLSRKQVKAGHEVTVVCADESKGGPGDVEGVKVVRLPYPFKIANTNVTPGLMAALEHLDCDVIHTHLPCPWSADISAMWARRRKKPLFLGYYNDIVGRGVNDLVARAYNGFMLDRLLGSCERIFVAHSRYLDYSPYLKRWRVKVRVLPFGVDTERFMPVSIPSGRAPVISILTKLDQYHRYKGLDVLFEALSGCAADFKLQVAGEGELRGHYEALAKGKGLGGKAVFHGAIKEEKLAEFYAGTDIFVLPSTSASQEGFGLVALEAMACGRPVVVSEIAGVADDVSRSGAGIVVRPGDGGSLREALEALLSDVRMREEMGVRARKLVEESFSWDRYARFVLEEYGR